MQGWYVDGRGLRQQLTFRLQARPGHPPSSSSESSCWLFFCGEDRQQREGFSQGRKAVPPDMNEV